MTRTAEFAVSHVVGKDDDHVGVFGSTRQGERRHEQQWENESDGFPMKR